MNRDDIHRLLRDALAQAAPDSDVHLIDPARPLQSQVELDPVRWTSFFAAVAQPLASPADWVAGPKGREANSTSVAARA